MANTREIKSRMDSVQDTQKITNAMYLIASTKLQKARRELEHTRPFFNALRGEIKRIFRTAEDIESRYFYPADGSPILGGTYGCLVITADKGLAGAYNMNVIKEAQQLLSEHPDTRLFVVGEYGRRYFQQHHIPIERSFLYTAQTPTIGRAREISSLMLDMFDQGILSKIFVIYTDMKKGTLEQVVSTRLLPFHRTHFTDPPREETGYPHSENAHFEFVPSIEAVLTNVVKSYVAGYIYGALVDSFCSEQNARMTAMDSANRNADKILSELSLRYNQVRQDGITQEITEVSSGAKAQRKKRNKERAGS